MDFKNKRVSITGSSRGIAVVLPKPLLSQGRELPSMAELLKLWTPL